MRHACCVALLALASGCQTPSTTTGWSFSVTKPPSIMSPAVISQQTGTFAIAPVAAYPAAAPVGPSRALALDPCVSPGSGPTLAFSTNVECTLEDVCRRLARIESQQKAGAGLGQPRPMPQVPGN